MPAVCSAFGCSERRSNSTAVTFHRFPKEATLREKWIYAIRRKNFKPGQGSYICSKHFKVDDFDTNVQSSVRLLRGTIPSVFSGFPSYLREKVVKPRPLTVQASIEPQSFADENHSADNGSDTVSNETASIISVNTIDHASSSNPAPDNSTSDVVDISTPIMKELKRELDLVQNKFETSLKKIKILQQSMRRLVKKNNSLKNIISEKRKNNMMSDASHGILGDLLNRKIAKSTGTPVKLDYSPQLRSFALTLHFYSPKAYRYVRRTFDTCLPHHRTLEKWYQSINGESGFTEEAFLQETEPSPCALVMNESAGECISIPPAAMSSSLLKNLLTLTETPSPKIILITGDFGSSHQLLVQQMVNQLLIQTPSCLYHVEASPFSSSSFCWSDTAPVQHFVSTFKCYGEDECPLDEALRHINTRPGQDLAAAKLSHLDDNTGDSGYNKPLKESNTAFGNERPVLLLEGLEAALLRTSARCLLANIRRAVQGRGMALLLCGSTDSLPPTTLTALKHAVSSSVHLTAIENSGQQQWQGIAHVQLKRPGGKLLNSCEYFKLSDVSVHTSPCNLDRLSSLSYETTPSLPAVSGACCGATPSCGLGTGQEQKVNTPKVDDRNVDKILSSQTTFSLKLSDQERLDKNSLELPHHRARGAGLVHYTPDREDWDEDDPDDDLDI